MGRSYQGNMCPVLGRRGLGGVPPVTPPIQSYPSAEEVYFEGGILWSSSNVCSYILLLWETFPRLLSGKYMCIFFKMWPDHFPKNGSNKPPFT